MKENEFTPGFRFSLLDGLFLLSSILLAYFAKGLDDQLSVIVLFVVAHFFLFCNVIRMNRASELIWACSFIVLCWLGLQFHLLSFYSVLLISLLVTVLLVFIEFRSKFYHGVCWQVFNPDLLSRFESIDQD